MMRIQVLLVSIIFILQTSCNNGGQAPQDTKPGLAKKDSQVREFSGLYNTLKDRHLLGSVKILTARYFNVIDSNGLENKQIQNTGMDSFSSNGIL